MYGSRMAKTQLKQSLRLLRNISENKDPEEWIYLGPVLKPEGQKMLFCGLFFFPEYRSGISFNVVLGPAPTHSVTFIPSVE